MTEGKAVLYFFIGMMRRKKMKNIRNGVFETNSSSSHSIAIHPIKTGDMLDTSLVPNNDGYIILTGGEFGWEYEKYNDALTKANYCAVDNFNDESRIEILKEVIIQQTGAKDVIIAFNVDNWDLKGYSYIDHQSHGTSNDAFASKDTLREFIFSRGSYLFTGNDNSYAPPNFYDTDLGIKYKYQVTVEGSDRIEKFRSKPSKGEVEEAIDRIMSEYWNCSYDRGWNARFAFYSWDVKVVGEGKTRNSLEQFDKKKIVLFRTESVYSNDKERKFKGDKILEEKVINFKVEKI